MIHDLVRRFYTDLWEAGQTVPTESLRVHGLERRTERSIVPIDEQDREFLRLLISTW